MRVWSGTGQSHQPYLALICSFTRAASAIQNRPAASISICGPLLHTPNLEWRLSERGKGHVQMCRAAQAGQGRSMTKALSLLPSKSRKYAA